MAIMSDKRTFSDVEEAGGTPAWEYLVIELAGTATVENWTAALNVHAAAGWELLQLALVESTAEDANTWNTYHAVLRRERPAE